jgi:hypothetical protein
VISLSQLIFNTYEQAENSSSATGLVDRSGKSFAAFEQKVQQIATTNVEQSSLRTQPQTKPR